MNVRRLALFFALLAVILILVFPMRAELAGTIVRGVAFAAWMFRIAMNIIPQQVMWMFLLILLLYIAIGSFYGKRLGRDERPEQRKQAQGAVEALAERIQKSERGTYFKWQVANMLGKVALHMLEKEHDPAHKLEGRGWSPAPQVQEYLHAGLNSSFVDYQPPGLFRRPVSGPLDFPLENAVAYLEEQMEIPNDET